jgi:putative transposase
MEGMYKPRELAPGARYHVSAQADIRLLRGRAEIARNLFSRVLERARGKHSFDVHLFCLFENTFHLVIRPSEGESLSKIMQWIMTTYAARFHRLAGSCGHVWNKPFSSKIIP